MNTLDFDTRFVAAARRHLTLSRSLLRLSRRIVLALVLSYLVVSLAPEGPAPVERPAHTIEWKELPRE